MQERPMIPHYQVCAGCEKAHRGVKICDRYPEGIPEKYRVRWEGLPDETGIAEECPDFEKDARRRRRRRKKEAAGEKLACCLFCNIRYTAGCSHRTRRGW